MRNFTNMTAGLVGMIANMKFDKFDDDTASVDGISRPNKEIMDEIKKEEEERLREEKKNAAKNQIAEDNCRQKYEAITLRKKRAEERAYADRLKARTEENEKYQQGDMDTKVHKENLQKIEDSYQKTLDKINREYMDACENLSTANPKAYNRVTRGW